jgi:methionyl-tRNA synthetase
MAKMIKDVNNAEITPEARETMQKKLDVILYYSIEATRVCALFLRIVVPNSADMILDQLSFPKSHRDRLVDEKMTTFGWHPTLDPEALGDTSQVVVVPFQKIKPPTDSKDAKTNASKKAKEAKRTK